MTAFPSRQDVPPAGDVEFDHVDFKPCCWRCKRSLAGYLGQPWSLICRKCHAQNQSKGEHPDAQDLQDTGTSVNLMSSQG